MRTKLGKRILAVVGIACLGVSLMFTPPATKTVSAAAPQVSETNKHIMEWVYWVDADHNKLYKRLLNCTTGNWAGDWIFVRDLEDWEVEYLLTH